MKLTEFMLRLLLFAVLSCFSIHQSLAQIVISEIMYHPVERPAFNADGSPVLDLYEDVHEFIEIHNAGSRQVDLTGWRLSGGIRFGFPRDTVLLPGEYRVVAKNPGRLAAVAAYGLTPATVLGPYADQLSNSKDTVRLENGTGDIVDRVSYSAEFPWAISADALGADEDFTGINPLAYQYRGRSLERVSFTHSANDPANWLASPLPGNPSPGKPNAVSLPLPKPIVINFSVAQDSDGSAVIRNDQPVRIRCEFSAVNALSNVSIEWFIEDINSPIEPRTTVAMAGDASRGPGHFSAVLPGQPNRSIVRFRIRADRGSGDEPISPRADDPFSWHAYFVSPLRVSTKPIYDCFISTSSLTILNSNISQSPKRVTTPDPPGNPRASWNATQPAIVVYEGVVYDARMRHHGSRYNRRASRNSFKWQFPRYKKFNGVTGIFETDKGNDFIVGQNLFVEAGLPDSRVRYVDLYLNNNTVMQRLEQGEFDGDMLDEFHKSQQALNPGTALQPSGEIYKVVGTIDVNGEGPYGRGDGRKLVKTAWTDLQMYDWTYSLQNNGWRGSYYFKQMIDALWAARGDSLLALNPNIPALRAFFEKYFDIDEMLNYIAIENWVCPWDDTTQNHFFWQQRNGKWGMLPWDCDAWFGRGDNTPASSSIYIGEVGDRNNNSRGPNYFKDSFLKAFREEYKRRLFILNNTFLHPENITAMGFGSIRTFANARFTAVNNQCGYGVFERPAKPLNLSPANNSSALTPASLQSSRYSHSAAVAPAHAKTTWEIRRATGTYKAPLWKVTNSTNLTSISVPFDQLTFGQTYFWRCTHFDNDDHPSFPSDETAFTFGGTVEQIPGGVRLNEIAARNRGSVTNGGKTPDWIELFNTGSEAIDLGGMSLSDDVLVPGKFTFPAKTVIAPQNYLIVWCDNQTNAPGVHAGFALNDKGQTLALFDVTSNGMALRDSVTFGSQIGDFTISRVSGEIDGWQLTVPTPGQANQGPALLGTAATLKINEWMATPASGDDWFELFNPDSRPVELSGLHLSDSANSSSPTRIAALSFIGAGGFAEFAADQKPANGADHVDFKLSANGDSIYLLANNASTVIDSVKFGPQGGGVSQGRLPDGGGTIVSFPTTASPGEENHLPINNVVINEVLAHSDPPLEDAIELYNPTASAVNISGWFLSDELARPKKFRIPEATILPANGFKVFYEYQFNADTNSPSSFALSSSQGDDLYLFTADSAENLTGYRTHVDFEASANGVSFGRVVTSQGIDFATLSRRTFGEDTPADIAAFRSGNGSPNALPSVGPVVISEIMYHPPESEAGDNTIEEFIELQNITAAPVPLFDPLFPTNTWRLREAVDFNFPTNVVLAPQSCLVVVSFDPATDVDARNIFQSKYGMDLPLFGPYSGKLDNGGESVKLYRPDPPQTLPRPDVGFVPYLLVDRVKYSDVDPWPAAADGLGPSLQRVTATAYGNDPANWLASAVTPGKSAAGPEPALDRDNDGIPDAWERANSLVIGINDAALDPDGDGLSNVQEYIAGTDPQSAASALKIEALKIGSDLVLRFIAQPNKGYSVQFRNDLENSSWQTYTNISSEAGSRTVQINNASSASGAARYFRVTTPPIP